MLQTLEPQIICYTAIIDGYDDLPTLKNLPESCDLVCFTNSTSLDDDEGGWRIIRTPKYFTDPKLVSGFLKARSDRLFGNDVISLWIDGNLRDVDVSKAISVGGPVTVLRHRVRSTVQEEITAVQGLGLEEPSTCDRHQQFLNEDGFPDKSGLSATMLLRRDHRDHRVRWANQTWWQIIGSGVRRDQLSFDYSLWRNGLTPEYYGVDWATPNELFSRISHKSTEGRAYGKGTRSPCLKTALPDLGELYPKDIGLAEETETVMERRFHRRLNGIVEETARVVEGNYCHFHKSVVSEFTPSDPRRSWKREYLRRSVSGCRNALEVGFNAGHSAVIMLSSNPRLSLTSVDIGMHEYTRPAAELLLENFDGRFHFQLGDSKDVLPTIPLDEYDFIHIDGGHDFETAKSDLEQVFARATQGTLLMVDDAYSKQIAGILTNALESGQLIPQFTSLPSSRENMLFAITNKNLALSI